MRNKGEDQISKRLGKTKSKVRWNIGRRELNHHFLEILRKDIELFRSPTCQK
jgi:hypothetical protein